MNGPLRYVNEHCKLFAVAINALAVYLMLLPTTVTAQTVKLTCFGQIFGSTYKLTSDQTVSIAGLIIVVNLDDNVVIYNKKSYQTVQQNKIEIHSGHTSVADVFKIWINLTDRTIIVRDNSGKIEFTGGCWVVK